MSSGFDEYAALARHLHDLHRTGQADAAQHATRSQRLGALADQLGHRLYAQWQRLAAIAQATGEQVPAAPPPLVAAPAPEPQPGQSQFGGYGHQPGGYGQHPPGGYGAGPGGGGQPWPAPHSSPPGRPGLPPPPRRPELATGEQRIRLPAGGAGAVQPAGGSAAGVGAPVSGVPVSGAPTSGAPVSDAPGSGDPAAAGGLAPDPEQELAAARRQLDEADAAAYEAEQAAARPPLLPGWSPLGRAVAVYLGFAVVVAVLQFTFFLNPMTLAVDQSTKWIWSCTGFPTMGFFIAYFVISKWGTSRLETDGGPRFPKLGFLISYLGAAVSMVLLLVFLQIGPF
ncbi:hypothetical protein O7632_15055 [Solwaraspora sp. WMMD406]|uniref:hypothetical protein n=1 Tax=Solwaraspora sp. WMMD406 TaxID=3016095 RepID=UPI002415C583|nr:hypothetical protein [Solwaraspora sp. WMMD406]MDG4765403.1 hypothetical protein [Solwaraspora sp. WMMD406]